MANAVIVMDEQSEVLTTKERIYEIWLGIRVALVIGVYMGYGVV